MSASTGRFKINLVRRFFIAGVCGGALILAVVLLVLYPFFPGTLIEFRYALFARAAPNSTEFEIPPAQLYANGFLRDDPGMIAVWRELAETELTQMANLPSGFDRMPTLKRAKILAQRNAGGGPRRFADRETLIDRLKGVPQGIGYCSDLSETFLALCNVNGIDAYEFTLTFHTIASVYCPEFGRWLAIDPQFCLLFKDESGQYLSPAMLRETGLAGRPIQLESFWDSTRGPAPADPIAHGYYDGPAGFRELIMTYGNNVFAVDELRRTWRWAPKPIRQLYFRAKGVMPEFHIVNDRHSVRARTLASLRLVTWCGLALPPVLMLPQIAVWMIGLFSARLRGRAKSSRAVIELSGPDSARP